MTGSSVPPTSSRPSAAVDVVAVSKQYRRNASVRAWLAAGVGIHAEPGAKPEADSVAALRDVTFSVRRGEAFGIIGRNGAGKSTLLQILAGTLRPTRGTCELRGRVTALLELGSGFNPEFTGRENIFLAGTILGFTREEMDRRFDAIARFADIGTFIEHPVRTYSTGMMMRVAFAVAISVSPDILIIDEALSVGDILFQQKCSQRLKEMVDAGVTLLVVTHDLSFVLNTCQRALWLDRGQVRFLGAAGDCVREYVTAMAALAGNAPTPSENAAAAPVLHVPATPDLHLSGRERLGDGGVKIARAWALTDNGEAGATFRVGEWAVVFLLIRAERDVRDVSGGCELRNRHGQVVFATGLRVVRRLIATIPRGDSCLVQIRFRLELQPGQYTLDVGCGAESSTGNTWDRVLNVAVLEVSSMPDDEPVHGLVRLPYEVSIGRPASP